MSERRSSTGEVITSAMGSAVQHLLRLGIDGFGPLGSAQDCARSAIADGRTSDEAITRLIRTHVALAASQGFLTNIGGAVTSAVVVPVNIGASIFLQVRLAASIACVRGYDVSNDEVRLAILLCLIGNKGIEKLKKAGMKVGERFAARMIHEIPMPIINAINRKVGTTLVTKTGRKRGVIVLSELVPVVGGVIGGGIDAASTRAVGAFARRYFVPEA